MLIRLKQQLILFINQREFASFVLNKGLRFRTRILPLSCCEPNCKHQHFRLGFFLWISHKSDFRTELCASLQRFQFFFFLHFLYKNMFTTKSYKHHNISTFSQVFFVTSVLICCIYIWYMIFLQIWDKGKGAARVNTKSKKITGMIHLVYFAGVNLIAFLIDDLMI